MRNDIIEREAEILQWIEENQSKAYMARQLNCNPKTINSIL
jgi:DNA-binding CsgD family transcriptional regulator